MKISVLSRIIIVLSLLIPNASMAARVYWCIEDSSKIRCNSSYGRDVATATCQAKVIESNYYDDSKTRIRTVRASASYGDGVANFLGETLGMFTLGLTNAMRADGMKKAAVKSAKNQVLAYIDENACF